MKTRLPYYSSAEYADFLKEEFGFNSSETIIERFINSGKLRPSLYYEWPDGKGWFFEDYPGRTDMIGVCLEPPVEKYYIRLAEAETFEREYFLSPAEQEPEPPEPVNAGGNEPHGTAQVKPFGGGIKKGISYTPVGRFIDQLRKEYSDQHKKECSELKDLMLYVMTGMGDDDKKYGYKVNSISVDTVELMIKRKRVSYSMADLEKTWEERKKRNPYITD